MRVAAAVVAPRDRGSGSFDPNALLSVCTAKPVAFSLMNWSNTEIVEPLTHAKYRHTADGWVNSRTGLRLMAADIIEVWVNGEPVKAVNPVSRETTTMAQLFVIAQVDGEAVDILPSLDSPSRRPH
jgi:hypothetical protein